MKKSSVTSSGAPAAIGPYSQAIRSGSLLFVSGQIPLDPQSGALSGQDIEAQARRVLDSLGAILQSAGLGFDDVVKTTIYLVDLSDFAAVNAVYASYFHTDPPARATVQVAGLPKGARVEIDAIAAFA